LGIDYCCFGCRYYLACVGAVIVWIFLKFSVLVLMAA